MPETNLLATVHWCKLPATLEEPRTIVGAHIEVSRAGTVM
jgi:hypothetical protein